LVGIQSPSELLLTDAPGNTADAQWGGFLLELPNQYWDWDWVIGLLGVFLADWDWDWGLGFEGWVIG
jgi:hypothetical protein